MRASIVIPSYNRGEKLASTLDCLLSSDTSCVDEIEILVVDDGSPVPITRLIQSVKITPPFSLRGICQNNSGPAAARNNGFRAAEGDIVIFVDDDILVPPNLIQSHVEAHRVHPGTIICGRCILGEPTISNPLFNYINSRGYDYGQKLQNDFVEIEVIASGQISVERTMFDAETGVYYNDLATPAAEEYELSYRLKKRRVPVLLATNIIATHDHPVTIENMCRQAFKHGLGCAEVALKRPETLELKSLKKILYTNFYMQDEGLGVGRLKGQRRRLSGPRARSLILGLAKQMEKEVSDLRLLAPVYKLALSSHFWAGLQTGQQRFAKQT